MTICSTSKLVAGFAVSSAMAFTTASALAQTAPAAAPPPATKAVSQDFLVCHPGTEVQKQEAITRYQRGVGLFEEQDYRLALVEFERAYELTCTPSVLYNIGVIHYTLNNYSAALRAFEEYLGRGGDSIDDKRRERVERDVQSLRARVAKISVIVNVPGAEVSFDDGVLGLSPIPADRLVDAGSHRISASKTGYIAQSKAVVLAVGDRQSVRIDLVPVPSAKREAPNYVWIGWATTAVLGGAATVTGILALNASSRADRLQAQQIPAGSTDLSDEAHTAKSLALATDILLGATIVSAGVSVYFTLKGTGAKKEKDDAFVFSPTSVSYHGHF